MIQRAKTVFVSWPGNYSTRFRAILDKSQVVAVELYFDSVARRKPTNYPFAHTRERLIYEPTRLAPRHPFLTNATSVRYERT